MVPRASRAVAVLRPSVRWGWRRRHVGAVLAALTTGLELAVIVALSACGVRQPASTTPTATLMPPAATATSAPGHIDEFTVFLPDSPYALDAIAAGPDGNLWVTYASRETSSLPEGIARITPSGTVSKFPLAHPGGEWGMPDITVGPDGALWFTDPNTSQIGRITTTGAITEFTLPIPDSHPFAITAGPDGALWFTDPGTYKAGRITPSGVTTEFAIPTPCNQPFAGITVGPDGALWFTMLRGSQPEMECFSRIAIGRITTTGTITEFTPTTNMPFGIAAGSDGNLWFVELSQIATGSIVRMTPTGSTKTFPLCSAGEGCAPHGIASGPDGALWFTDPGANKIGRITTAGAISEFALPTPDRQPFAITAGPSRALWFTEWQAGKIGRITA